jgi:hypothetical protein
MIAYDYSRPLASARRMIERFGRPVALQSVSEGPADPAQPLAGPAAPPAPVTGVWAAFVQPSSLQALGLGVNVTKLFATSEQIALIAPKDDYAYSDMKFLYDVNDNNRKWVITHIEVFKPGDTVVLHFIGVKSP